MNEILYYKYIINEKYREYNISKVTCSNYEIEKNSNYPEISYNKYLIGYNLHIEDIVIYIPLFDNYRFNIKNKVLQELKKKSIIKTLYECGLTCLIVECISKYL